MLRKYARTQQISRNGQAVTIIFNDFIVDVIPAFYRENTGYLIPNSITNNWIATNPKIHVDIMIKNNSMHNSMLVPIVKMIKCWNRNINYDFVSFYLELLAINIFKNVKLSNFSSGMRSFFDKGRKEIKYQLKDPVQYGGFINPLYNCKTVDNAVSRFETAYKRATKAEQYAEYEDIESAVGEWRKIFGDYFPVYG